jgi:two-component system, OmpR family, phosphate regulon sensor histidine kinase PhoR
MASSAVKIPKIWLVVVLMSAALLGIILVQAYWIHNAISLRRTIFNQQVNEAMHAAVRQLDRHRAADMLEEHADFFEAEMPFWSASDSSAFSLADTLDLLSWAGPHPLNLEDAGHLEFIDSLESPLPALPFALGSTVYDPAQADESEVLSALLRDAEAQIVANIRRFGEVFEDLVGELVRGQYANFRRIDPVLLDSLLGVEFRQKGIYTPYAYAVLLGGENLLTSAGDDRENEALLSSVHRVQINEFNLFGPPDELYVNFPGENDYLLRSIWTLLSGSALFTLVIIIGFSYTVFALQYQKEALGHQDRFHQQHDARV